MNSCHKFVQLVRNTVLKLYTDCGKQYDRSELNFWKNQLWILHHDNAPAHTWMLVFEFWTKNKTVIMPQPPYSPDLGPAEFFLFPELKTPIKRKCFTTIEEIKEKSIKELLVIPKSAFQKCFEDWKSKCTTSMASYCEGSKIVFNK